ncbi:MAG: LptF/LptG family permease [Prevotella sp.]|nr:LptF/LptG family permease [Prevotella sp.]
MRGIKKLDSFMVRQFMLLFVATFFICQFVLMMQFLWRYVEELIGKGISMEIMAQFFWYMGLSLVPQALPLTLLLSSLITFGNLGESSELTAIKAAGISLMQAMRSLIVVAVLTTVCSFYFQNYIAPAANLKMMQLLISMKQKSPEMEIPEGIFYGGIPGSNIYVQKKDMETGKLYGIMIYRRTASWEDQQIILADSGMLQSTADKQHLRLSLWSGEWLENMQSQQLGGTATVPYQRQTFVTKVLLLDYDGDFNMTDAALISGDARNKGLSQILHDRDSLSQAYDSIGREFYTSAQKRYFSARTLSHRDSLTAQKRAQKAEMNPDTLFNRLSEERKQRAVNLAQSQVQTHLSELSFNQMITKDGDREIRLHELEAINKFTLALSCLIFFFIGASLGAIIRKGGLGFPVIVSVFVFIVFFILDYTGTQMAKSGAWGVWFGKLLATAVLAPLAVFFTYKANNDSAVFNMDAYRTLFRRMLGLRLHRHVNSKEVIIEDPIYSVDSCYLLQINEDIKQYSAEHKLLHLPNPVKVFFRPGDDQTIEQIVEKLEDTIDDLSNSKDRQIISLLNQYPIVATRAHTRPFRQKWLNIVTGLILPLGLFFYLRMCRFRLRLRKDLGKITETNREMVNRIAEYAPPAPVTLADLEHMTFIEELIREVEAKRQKQRI